MNPTLKKILGWTLIIIGIIGLFLPILQGILFIIAGSALLGNTRIKDWFVKQQEKYKEWRKHKQYK